MCAAGQLFGHRSPQPSVQPVSSVCCENNQIGAMTENELKEATHRVAMLNLNFGHPNAEPLPNLRRGNIRIYKAPIGEKLAHMRKGGPRIGTSRHSHVQQIKRLLVSRAMRVG
jgi:hypothetical protein